MSGARSLLWSDVCPPNDPRPLFSVIGDKLSELSGRTWGYYHSPKIDEPRFDNGVGDRQIDFHVEPIKDRSGRIFRRTETKPCIRFVARDKVSYGRNFGQYFQARGRGHRKRRSEERRVGKEW